jgi:hypothetical protein
MPSTPDFEDKDQAEGSREQEPGQQGMTKKPLAEEQRQQEKLPRRGTAKSSE